VVNEKPENGRIITTLPSEFFTEISPRGSTPHNSSESVLIISSNSQSRRIREGFSDMPAPGGTHFRNKYRECMEVVWLLRERFFGEQQA